MDMNKKIIGDLTLGKIVVIAIVMVVLTIYMAGVSGCFEPYNTPLNMTYTMQMNCITWII